MAALTSSGAAAGDARSGTPPTAGAGVARGAIGARAGDASPATQPPVATNWVPAKGSPIGTDTSLQFDLLSIFGIASAKIVVQGVWGPETVYDSAAGGFTPSYQSSSVVPIQSGLRFTIIRTGGWQLAPVLAIDAMSNAGGVA